ncbi:MAG: hypothetical protein KF711_04980, partial [Nitrospira sp.]|nr:hypothetical protein [Nitrospira sp.]
TSSLLLCVCHHLNFVNKFADWGARTGKRYSTIDTPSQNSTALDCRGPVWEYAPTVHRTA